MSDPSKQPEHAPPGNNPNYYSETASLGPIPDAAQHYYPPDSSTQHQAQQSQQQHAPAQASSQAPPQAPTQQPAKLDHYPPPPPGPPPSQHPLQQHPVQSQKPQSQEKPPVQQQQEQQPYYPPPPPGPPPTHTDYGTGAGNTASAAATGASYGSKQQEHQQQQQANAPYFPPPPTYTEKPPIGSDQPPSTAQHATAGAAGAAGAGFLGAEEARPNLPPRPASGQSGGQQFAPPPGQVPQDSTAAGAAAATAEAGSTKPNFSSRLYNWSIKAGLPINKVTNRLGSEAFWPTSMDKECDKAARILKSFTKDGFYADAKAHPGGEAAAASSLSAAPPKPSPGHPESPGPNKSGKSLVKIPQSAIKNATGLAIFTTLRTGFHISGASGSGIVIARLPDGSWSPPSGFLVHTLGAGFMVGLDIYDCVCVLNTQQALDGFTKPRLSLGGEVAVVAGPVGGGVNVEGVLGKGAKPVWSYMKSRGFYAGVQADGTIIVQRPDANAAFYGEKLPVEKILRGEVPQRAAGHGGHHGLGSVLSAVTGHGHAKDSKEDASKIRMWPEGARNLIEVVKSAEGKKVDEHIIDQVSQGPTPGDLGLSKEEAEQVAQQSGDEKGDLAHRESVRYA